MTEPKSKPLMRALGEFVGHIVKAVKADPRDRRAVVNKTSREASRGNVTLRRTTVDEIEIHDRGADRGS